MDYYVQYGCGLSAPSTWTNFDVSPTLRLQNLPLIGHIFANAGIGPRWPQNVQYGDITKGLPIPYASCRGVYCSHVLEHLSLEGFRKALKNTYNYLNKKGVFRFVLPDLERMVKEYSNSNDSEAAIKFIKSTRMGLQEQSKGIKGILSAALGNVEHLWLWDYESIKLELQKAGFTEIRRAAYGDASDPMFNDVENEDRWTNELGVECKKK